METDNTFSIIAKLYKGMNEMLISELNAHHLEGIVPSHGSILLALSKHNTLTMNALADYIGKTPQTVTTLVKKLQQLGYIHTEKHPEDKRITLVSLTSQGKQLETIIHAISRKIYARQYAGMQPEQILLVRELLLQMSQNFSLEEPADY